MELINLLADDKKIIGYRPRLNEITGSVIATILLQQIIFRANQVGYRPFYKFRTPCAHELYRETDSWTEELGFSSGQFDTALKKIATKIKKGDSKTDALKSESVNSLVIYWTDSNRVTWYYLNIELLNKKLQDLYANSGNGNYLVNQETATSVIPDSAITYYSPNRELPSSEITSENTPEITSDNLGTAQNSKEETGDENTSVKPQSQTVAVSDKDAPDGAEGGEKASKSEGTIEGGGLQGVVVKDRRPKQKGGGDNARRMLQRSTNGRVYSETGGRGGKGGEGIRSGHDSRSAGPGVGRKTGKPPPWVNARLPPNSEGGRYLQSQCWWWKGFENKEQQREFERLERRLVLPQFMAVIDGLLKEGNDHHDVAESVIERAKTMSSVQNADKKTTNSLLPDMKLSRMMFGRLQASAKAQGRRGPAQFKTLEQKSKLDEAAARLGEREFKRALIAGLEQGINSVARMTNWIAKWNGDLQNVPDKFKEARTLTLERLGHGQR